MNAYIPKFDSDDSSDAPTRFAMIASVTNPDNGEITLYVANEPWGPVVTGKNLAEAKVKMKEAFGLTMIVNSYLDTEDTDSQAEALKKISNHKQEFKRLDHTLECLM